MGQGPGEFGLVTDVVRDADGNYYVSEYGEYDRIQKFTPDGKFMLQWGGHGTEPGQFLRPQHLEFDADGLLWVADACNHRIQVFDRRRQARQDVGHAGQRAGADCSIRTAWRSTARATCTSASTATTACRSSRSTASRSPAGAAQAASRASSTTRGRWCSTAAAACHVLDSMNHRVQRFVM